MFHNKSTPAAENVKKALNEARLYCETAESGIDLYYRVLYFINPDGNVSQPVAHSVTVGVWWIRTTMSVWGKLIN